MLCIPDLDDGEEVSHATLLMTAMLMKAKDEDWAKALIDEVFDRLS